MCGIVGYIGKENPISILIQGLKDLEYRGYDSAGIALKNKDNIQIIKSIGKITNLQEKCQNTNLISSNIGIAHTRWATHGAPSKINAHPHKVGKTTIVHNGIIENAALLKEQLVKEGIKFNSDTDTEVIAALINKYYKNDPIKAIEKATSELVGSYALAILFDDKEKLYAIRKDSPLIVGIKDNAFFVASDITAIINYTKNYVLLEENEIAEMTQNHISYYYQDKEITKKVLTADIKSEAKDKNGYEHYMLKEIMEEPLILENTLKPYLKNLDLLPNLKDYEEIHIVACGSAMYAGMVGKTLLEERAQVKVFCECASEYRYKNVIYDCKTLVILISQSGETADTIAAMRNAHSKNIDTLAIVNVKTSTIAREAKMHLFIEAGPEIAVATTKAYILQVALMALLAFKIAYDKKIIKDTKILADLQKAPCLIKEILENRKLYLKIAKEIYQSTNIFFIGRKVDYAIALEGSLKLKEVSYIHSEAYQAGELKHGTISLIDEKVPVFAIITDKQIEEKTLSNVEEVKSRGAKVIVITNNKNITNYPDIIYVPKINEFFQSLLVVPTLQLIAYETAKLRGCDIDKPKNLAKSVTVE